MRDRVRDLTIEVMKELGMDEKIKIELKPMKKKLASYSFTTKTLRINSCAAEKLNDDQLKFIITHELIHIKTGSIDHGEEFIKELKKIYSDKSENIEIDIIKTLLYKS